MASNKPKSSKKGIGKYRTKTYGAAWDLHGPNGAWDIVVYFWEKELEALLEHCRRGTNDVKGKVGPGRLKMYLHKKQYKRGGGGRYRGATDYYVTVRLFEGAWGWEDGREMRRKGEKVAPVEGDIFPAVDGAGDGEDIFAKKEKAAGTEEKPVEKKARARKAKVKEAPAEPGPAKPVEPEEKAPEPEAVLVSSAVEGRRDMRFVDPFAEEAAKTLREQRHSEVGRMLEGKENAGQ